jgi:hypothetical protein
MHERLKRYYSKIGRPSVERSREEGARAHKSTALTL